jgi:D-glycero-alpha-D-manno-heptose-7-phosphate kinase
LFLASEIVAGSGLGSSVSVCVGVLKALTTYLGLSPSKYDLAEHSFHIAREVLGKPVGKQDEYAAAFGGLNFITFNRDGSSDVEPLGMRSDQLREFESNLMLFFTGVAHDSWKLLREQEQSTKQQGSSTVESLHQLRDLATCMRDALLKGNINLFGEMMHIGWEAKKSISSSISNPFIDEAYSVARQNGAIGGKITGAGGGGFLLLFCHPKNQNKVRDALTKLQLREMAFGLDNQGAKIVVNDPFIDKDERCGMRWTFCSPLAMQHSASSIA